MKVVFFGTPDFAIPCADVLLKHHKLLAVVTAVDKPAGRGHQLNESPIKKWAISKNIEILQPKNLKSEKFINKLKSYNADIFVVVAFRMLPESVWNLPPQGTINIHASILPDYRGAAPIQRAIMAGEKSTGVTCFKLQQEIDTGDILMSRSVEIDNKETGGQLHDKLSIEGSILLKDSLELLESGKTSFQKQTSYSTKIAAKIHSEDTFIRWDQSVEMVYNFIRALSPYPTAKTIHENEIYKIYSSEPSLINEKGTNGQWKLDSINHKLFIKCNNGWLSILEIQAPSKRRMLIKDFVNGLKNK